MHIGPEEREYQTYRNQPTRTRAIDPIREDDLVISRDTAERWLKRITITGTFIMGMLIGGAIKWWLS